MRSKVFDIQPWELPQVQKPLTYTAEGSPFQAIIQTLNRENKGVCLRRKAFEPTVKDWERVPLIFAQDHPDPPAYDRDPEAELAKVNGRLVKGTASGAEIVQTGHPTLRINFNFQDPEIEHGIEAGKISTSNCFRPTYDEAKRLVGVQPHHILFFREEGQTRPGDGGVLIMRRSQ